MTQEQNQKFYQLLADFNTAMLISKRNDSLYARPMAIVQVEKSCDLWFISSEATEKIEEIKADPKVHITCQRDHGCYLSLEGTAETTKDRSKIGELWKPSYKVWFPEGKDDPKIILISVKAESGEYWDNRGTNGIKYFFKAIMAVATKTTPDEKDAEQHGEVSL